MSANSPSLNPRADPNGAPSSTSSVVPRSLPSLPPTIIPTYSFTTGNDNKDCATWVSKEPNNNCKYLFNILPDRWTDKAAYERTKMEHPRNGTTYLVKCYIQFENIHSALYVGLLLYRVVEDIGQMNLICTPDCLGQKPVKRCSFICPATCRKICSKYL